MTEFQEKLREQHEESMHRELEALLVTADKAGAEVEKQFTAPTLEDGSGTSYICRTNIWTLLRVQSPLGQTHSVQTPVGEVFFCWWDLRWTTPRSFKAPNACVLLQRMRKILKTDSFWIYWDAAKNIFHFFSFLLLLRLATILMLNIDPADICDWNYWTDLTFYHWELSSFSFSPKQKLIFDVLCLRSLEKISMASRSSSTDSCRSKVLQSTGPRSTGHQRTR